MVKFKFESNMVFPNFPYSEVICQVYKLKTIKMCPDFQAGILGCIV